MRAPVPAHNFRAPLNPLPPRIVVLILCLLAPAVSRAAEPYLARLQARAARLHLARSRYWHILLHYESNWLGPGVTSSAVTPWFFNAPSGRTNPKAELDATLAAFVHHKRIAEREEPAACVFIARYHWLNSQLHFDPNRLAPPHCPAFRHWIKALDPQSVSVVFPTAYINSPASMFGHTLLRIDSGGDGSATQLLAYAVNYAADVNQTNGLTFAIKGMTGGYPGRFGLFPYYDKVKQYTRIENRDIWSYKLNLTHAQIMRLLRHLWELKGVDFPYYFFRSNCSFQLLALLEAARPNLDLTGAFPVYAIPTDTLRVLARQPGLVRSVSYRPSRATTLQNDLSQIDDKQQRVALAVADGKLIPKQAVKAFSSPIRQAQTLQVAHDTVAYRFAANKLPRARAVKRARRILLARSRIPVTRVFDPVPRPKANPVQGHGTALLAAGLTSARGHMSLSLRLRPAYQDLLDPLAGYQPGAQINFFDLGLDYGFHHGGLRVRDFKLIDIASVTPRTAFFKPVSWRVQTGLRRAPAAPLFGDHPGHLGYYLQGGPGLAYGDPARLSVFAFALAGADANTGLHDGYRLGAGPELGLLAHPAPGWSMKLTGGVQRYMLGDSSTHYRVAFGQQWQISRNNGIRLQVAFNSTDALDWTRVELSYRRYF